MEKHTSQVQTGLDILINERLDLIKGKKIGLVTNHTGVDRNGQPNYELFLRLKNIYLKSIFAPEHGFFGNFSAGQNIEDQHLKKFPIIYSLYGNTRKPTPEMLDGLDLIIYDIQDIGTRFYTYISTLGLVMEAAGEVGIPVIVLDRPNPLSGLNMEGPILDLKHKSFVGMYPIPIRYGLTAGELAKMIIGEKWISATPELTVVKIKGWKRNLYFNETNLTLIPTSPNIPDIETAVIYPGMCLIEGTNLSEGRGTDHPFQWIGAPWIDGQKLSQIMNKKHLPGIVFEPISFTPITISGKALNPKYENERCDGVYCKILDFRDYNSVSTGVQLIRTIKKLYPEEFEWNDFIYKLWGIDSLLEYDSKDESFKQMANKYYLYE